MLDVLPLLVLGIGFYLREFRKDVSQDYFFIFTFVSLLCLPLALFSAGAVADANSADAVATLFFQAGYGFALIWIVLIMLHLSGILLEAVSKDGQVNINKKVQM